MSDHWPMTADVTTWPTTQAEAQHAQHTLRRRVRIADDHGPITTVAGVDAGYEDELARAAIVVLAYPSLLPLEYTVAYRPAPLPYIPGLLSFREGPAVVAALEQLTQRPDALILDGQGIAHPLRLGIAAHLGALLDIPAVGCAKSLLCGRHAELPDERGAHVPLIHHGETIGVALRTRAGTKPVFVSVGHRFTLASAIDLVIGCTTKYRLPETTRAAHNLASNHRPPS
jgi:deoxyribonuclease V